MVTICVLALIIGFVAGLRTFMALVAVSWAAHVGWLQLSGTWLGFLGSAWTAWIFTALALFEVIADQLPSTPRRTVPPQFGARIAAAALSGAAIGASGGAPVLGAVVAIVGAVIGTVGGVRVRTKLAAAFNQDRPAALIEDAIAIAIAVTVVAL
jgi:uncharacterized membrane protein